MPSNKLVFDNLSPLLYTSLVHHCKRVGYTLVDSEKHGYTIALAVKMLTPVQKYVSPDVLLFHTRIKVELLCQIFNFSSSLIAQKTFYFSTLISKPINPILTSSFLDFEYKKLFERSVPKIEQYIRPLVTDNESYGI
jgi:hypothetical protein